MPSSVVEPPAAQASVTPVEQTGTPVAAVSPAQAPVPEVSVDGKEDRKDVALSVADLIRLHKDLSKDQPASPSQRVHAPEGAATQAPASTDAASAVVPPPETPQPAAAPSPPVAAEESAAAEPEADSQQLPEVDAQEGDDETPEEPSPGEGAFRLAHRQFCFNETLYLFSPVPSPLFSVQPLSIAVQSNDLGRKCGVRVASQACGPPAAPAREPDAARPRITPNARGSSQDC